MEAKEALDFLNEMPYMYLCVGVGVDLKLAILGKEIHIKKDRNRGGVDFSHPHGVFHFEWDRLGRKWVIPKP